MLNDNTWNSWNHLIVCKWMNNDENELLVLDNKTCNYFTVCKQNENWMRLLALETNNWNHLTVEKQKQH